MIDTLFRYSSIDVGLACSFSGGVSSESDLIGQSICTGRSRLQTTRSFGRTIDLQNDLASLFEEYQYPNWDGYGALPVTFKTYLCALRLIDSLPLGFPSPSLGAEPDGEITFEWYTHPNSVLSISLGESSILTYAAVLPGGSRVKGVEPFLEGIPWRLLTLIVDVNERAF